MITPLEKLKNKIDLVCKKTLGNLPVSERGSRSDVKIICMTFLSMNERNYTFGCVLVSGDNFDSVMFPLALRKREFPFYKHSRTETIWEVVGSK